MGVEEKVKIVEADDRFLLGQSAEAILVDEQPDILLASEMSARSFLNLKESTSYIVYISLFALIEVLISLVEDVHSQNPSSSLDLKPTILL